MCKRSQAQLTERKKLTAKVALQTIRASLISVSLRSKNVFVELPIESGDRIEEGV